MYGILPFYQGKVSFHLFLSFRQPSIRLAGDAESPFLLSNAVLCVRPADLQ